MAPKDSVKIVVVGGVRPQFIKIAALQDAIEKHNYSSKTKIVAQYINSSQHYDNELSKVLIDELGLHFDYTLSHHSNLPIEMLGSMIVGIYNILDSLDSRPDWVVVIGDTTTTLAGAIAATRKLLPVVHVEAGVRSGKLNSMEEMHRKMVSHVSTVHFCYSKQDTENLRLENIVNNVYWTGDLAYSYFSNIIKKIPAGYGSFPFGEYILVSIHKPQNLFSENMLVDLVAALNKQFRPVLFVMHPRCQERLKELNLLKSEKITYNQSLNYTEMLSAIKGCAFVITDSGGVRRESFYLNKPCLVRKDSVGWLAPFQSGQSKLIGRSDYTKELEWAEQRLIEGVASNISDFVRGDSIELALEKLIDLA
jgi:UDP-GlcNAc3NAcA epimerase